MKSFVTVVLCLLLATSLTYAQGVGASGDLKGTVTDPQGAAVSNATVTVVQPERGTKRTTTTDSDGNYRVPGLPPANYDVTVERSGFATLVQKGVVVRVGEIVNLDFHLKLSTVATTVEVSAAPPLVETDRGSQADTVTQQYITDLPIDRRDYLTYTLLMPGTSQSNQLTASTDGGFRVVQTPQSGVSFYGSNGRGNSVTVDGGEANDDGGGVRLTVTQEAVQEFQINRSNYNAELGGASGGAINVVTKSGTNKLHGTLFAFFRDDAMDARNPFSIGPALAPGQIFDPALPDSTGVPLKDSLSRQQFGGSVGFPITPDKTFLYMAYEGLRRDEEHPAPLFTSTNIFRPNAGQTAIISGLAALPGNPPVPCLTGQPALPAATCAAILTNILTVNPAASPLDAFLVNEFETNSGLFPFADGQDLGVIRLDHRFSEKNQVFFRFNAGRDDQADPNLQALTGFSRAANTHFFDATALASWFHTFSPMTLNEAHFQYNYSSADYASNDSQGVGLDINGFGLFGSNIFLPSFTIMRRYEAGDGLTLLRGHHTIKLGGDFVYRGNHTESHTFFPGRFVFGDLPGGILSPCLQVPAACGLTANPTTLNAMQSFSLGLPQFYQQGFDNPVYNYPRPFTALYAQDSWAVRENLTLNFGLRWELDSQYGPLNTYYKDFAPRVSFAWDPFKDHKTVVRGGFGIFYSPVYGQIPDVVQTLGLVNDFRQIAQVLVPLTGVPGLPPTTNSAAIFQTFFALGLVQCGGAGNTPCIPASALLPFGINITHTGAVPPLTVLFAGQPDYRPPYSEQASFGVEREVAPGWSVGLTYIYVHGLRYPWAIDTNLLPTTPTKSLPLANGGTATFHNWAAPQCAVLVSNPCFGNLLLLQGNVYSSEANSVYHAGIFELKKRFSNHYSIGVNYTYSKAIDDATDYNSDFAASDQVNLAGERGLSDFDQRHSLVVYAAFESPWQGGADASTFEKIFSGFTLTPIFSYHSGHPFNLLAGTDVNGDRHSTTDRTIGAGRNTGVGPNYFSWDMRLQREFKLGDRASLDLMAEGFNILNHTNYGSVNNIVGPNLGLPTAAGGQGFLGFAVSGTNLVGPSSPLGFTSALAKREVQLGLRLNF